MDQPILLDYNNMMSPRLGGRGIDPETLRAAAPRFAAAHQAVAAHRQEGELGFFQLPDDREVASSVQAFADRARREFDTVVVLGIGGSALGTIALQHALLPPFWNELDAAARGGLPRLHVLDNVDPTTIAPLLDRLDFRRTLVIVISKSGATAETMAQFLIVRERLARVLGADARDHLVFVTDPAGGVLRRLAADEDVVAFPIPRNVGGRFSVLSAVGLLPAALVGIDIRSLLDGARAMDERCRTDVLERNPAGLFAVLQHLAHTAAAASMHVMMSYGDRLYAAADWFRQLWAESLGKRLNRDGAEVFVGPTPVRALGATDQHSQVQLYMEGPFDKTITFLTLRELPTDLAIPDGYPEIEALGYLGGHTLGELLRAEGAATAQALAQAGRMNMAIELPALTPHALGQLLMLLQIATVYAGELYGVDPLDQPGVELGKRLTYALMGRPGFDAPPAQPPDARWTSV